MAYRNGQWDASDAWKSDQELQDLIRKGNLESQQRNKEGLWETGWRNSGPTAEGWIGDLDRRSKALGLSSSDVEAYARQMEADRLASEGFRTSNFHDDGRLTGGPARQFVSQQAFNALDPNKIDASLYQMRTDLPAFAQQAIAQYGALGNRAKSNESDALQRLMALQQQSADYTRGMVNRTQGLASRYTDADRRIENLANDYAVGGDMQRARSELRNQESALRNLRGFAEGNGQTIAEMQSAQAREQARRSIMSQLASQRGGFNPAARRNALFALSDANANIASNTAVNAAQERRQALLDYITGSSGLSAQSGNLAAQSAQVRSGLEAQRGAQTQGLLGLLNAENSLRMQDLGLQSSVANNMSATTQNTLANLMSILGSQNSERDRGLAFNEAQRQAELGLAQAKNNAALTRLQLMRDQPSDPNIGTVMRETVMPIMAPLTGLLSSVFGGTFAGGDAASNPDSGRSTAAVSSPVASGGAGLGGYSSVSAMPGGQLPVPQYNTGTPQMSLTNSQLQALADTPMIQGYSLNGGGSGVQQGSGKLAGILKAALLS